jgi:transcriptional regulator with XRE-family HTH domain
MAWVLIKGALRRLRNAQKIDRKEAARRTGLRPITVRRHESLKDGPRTLQAETVKRYADAYKCDRETFAKWEEHGAAPPPDDDGDTSDPGAPALSTLSQRAERERELGGAKTVSLPTGYFDAFGPAILKKCMTACALYKDRCFAVAGRVEDSDHLPEPAARTLGVEVGAGARFRMTGKVAKGVPFYATVFTRDLEHTRQLLERGDDRKKVTVIVRVVVKPPEKDWKGFFIFEKRPVPRPFAFVVEQIVSAEAAQAYRVA